ncbi:hypothetical protein Csa_001668 [Cucumis sativus]|uniref:Transmembrane protein n=1 Tax=Cucumis sativus TaxID=3659 RepID=A0A0A0LE80_CUCSA|nr:hypothetical protein Csa_001668 [Cucumis sativus]
MSWVVEERGPEWKYGWTERKMSSMSLPPMPLLAFLGVVVLLLSLQSQQMVLDFKLLLLALPFLMIFVANSVAVSGTVGSASMRTKSRSAQEAERTSPWGAAVLLFLLLILLWNRPYFRSKWSPPS